MENQLTCFTFKNWIPQFCGWFFCLETSKKQTLLKNCDLHVVYMLSFCELHRNILTEYWSSEYLKIQGSLLFQPLKEVDFWGSAEKLNKHHWNAILNKNKTNSRKSANGGILLRKSDRNRYFSTNRQYPQPFCYKLPAIFFGRRCAFIVEKFRTKVQPWFKKCFLIRTLWSKIHLLFCFINKMDKLIELSLGTKLTLHWGKVITVTLLALFKLTYRWVSVRIAC